MHQRFLAFGRFLNYDEYEKMIPHEWAKYPGIRHHLWDWTNIKLNGTPRDAVDNARTFSSYYLMNCGKPGICNAPGGCWISVAPICTGGITDGDHLMVLGVLEEQRELAERDDGPPVCLMTDKGPLIEVEALAAGGQTVAQPAFANHAISGQFAPLASLSRVSIARECPNRTSCQLGWRCEVRPSSAQIWLRQHDFAHANVVSRPLWLEQSQADCV